MPTNRLIPSQRHEMVEGLRGQRSVSYCTWHSHCDRANHVCSAGFKELMRDSHQVDQGEIIHVLLVSH